MRLIRMIMEGSKDYKGDGMGEDDPGDQRRV